MGPMHESARQFLVDLGRKISGGRSGDEREDTFLFRRTFVLLHRSNSVLSHNSFISLQLTFALTALSKIGDLQHTDNSGGAAW